MGFRYDGVVLKVHLFSGASVLVKRPDSSGPSLFSLRLFLKGRLRALENLLRCTFISSIKSRSAFALCAGMFWFSLAASSVAQSNIVFNGSFEQSLAGWTSSSSYGIHAFSAAADGQVSISVYGSIWQDLNTVPGRDYVVSYASSRGSGNSVVTWGDTAVGPFTNLVNDAFWYYHYCYVHADSNVTRLTFAEGASMTSESAGCRSHFKF